MRKQISLSLKKTGNLQARLMLVFSILLVFCVLALSVFLFNVL